MSTMWNLLRQDLVLAWRNGHIIVAAVLAALVIALILFLPAEIRTAPREYVLDEISGSPVRNTLLDMGTEPEALPTTRAALEEALAAHRGSTGVVIGGSLSSPAVEFVLQTEITDSSLALLEATVDYVLASAGAPRSTGAINSSTTDESRGGNPAFDTELLRPEAARIPLNLAGVPIFLAFEVGILGFLLVAVFVFSERQEGTIRAYRVTPAGALRYVVSKVLTFAVMALVYGVVVVVVARGYQLDWPAMLALIVWASSFMTLLGLGFAVWFQNLSQWFFPGLAVLMVNMVPFFSYSNPAFNPAWVRVIPSYGLVFSLREVLFPTGDAAIVGETLLLGLAWLAGAFVFALFSVRERLMKGA